FGLALRASRAAACVGGSARLAGVWDGAVRGRVRGAFARLALPYGADALAAVERRLDDYSRHWAAERDQLCVAARAGGAADPTRPLRVACLDRRLDELAALTQLFGEADAQVVEHARRAVDALPPLADCSDEVALRGLLATAGASAAPPDAAERAAL